MTKEEFEEGYAERSGVTIKWLRDHGRVAAPCDCGDDTCQGWQMKHTDAPNKPVEQAAEKTPQLT